MLSSQKKSSNERNASLRGKRVIVYDPQILISEMEIADNSSFLPVLHRIHKKLEASEEIDLDRLLEIATKGIEMAEKFDGILDALVPARVMMANQSHSITIEAELKLSSEECTLIRLLRESPMAESLDLVYRMAAFETSENLNEEEKDALYHVYNLKEAIDGKAERIQNIILP